MHRTPRRLRAAAAITATLIAAATLTACTSGGGSSADQTLVIQNSFIKGSPTGEVFRTQMKAFTKKTGIKVQIKDVAVADYQKVFEADSLAGKEADILTDNLVGGNLAWEGKGLTVDAGPLIKKWGLSDRVQPSALKAWTNDKGVTSGFPYVSFVWPVWYNKALFDKAGAKIPSTYSELVEASKKLRAAGIQPFVVGGGDWPGNNFMYLMMNQFASADAVKKAVTTGQFCSDSGIVKGLDMVPKMQSDGVFADNISGYTSDTMTAAYFNGDAAMMPSGSWAIPTAPEDIRKNTVLAGFPVPTGGEYKKPTMWFGDTSTGIWITKNGNKKIDAAQKFVEFMYDAKNVAGYIDNADLIPSLVVPSGAPTPKNPLLAQAVKLHDDNSQVPQPDPYIPPTVDTQATANALFAGASGKDTCASLEKVWKDAAQ
jgi:multiple sugar transport system substrate-binding protein